MGTLFPPYAIFSAIAIVVKIAMLFRYRRRLSAYSVSFKVLFACLFWLNIFELISFYYPSADRLAYLLLLSYYVAFLVGMGMLSVVCLSTSGMMSRRLGVLVGTTISIVVVLTLVPDIILAGVRHIGFTFTRIPGQYYWVFQIILLLFIATDVSTLAHGCLRSTDQWRRTKSKALLLSLTPLFLVVPTVLALMHIGVPVTGTVFGSFAILFFLVTLMATETEIIKESRSHHGDQQIFRFLSSIPVTSEFQIANRVRRAVATEYSNDLVKAVANYENTLIQETLAVCEGNKSTAAKLLGISRTTLRRKLAANSIGGSDGNSDLKPLQNETC